MTSNGDIFLSDGYASNHIFKFDKTGKYLLAAATGGDPDLTMYSFDTAVPGKLDTATSVATGVDPAGAVAIAATH